MAGFSKIFVIGGKGGYVGADGVNPIDMLILVGDASRQWLEPRYLDKQITPIGSIGAIVPAGPDHPDALIDACIAFCPRYFGACPSLTTVEAALQNADRLDFDASPQEIPAAWARLREEARPIFSKMGIWSSCLEWVERP